MSLLPHHCFRCCRHRTEARQLAHLLRPWPGLHSKACGTATPPLGTPDRSSNSRRTWHTSTASSSFPSASACPSFPRRCRRFRRRRRTQKQARTGPHSVRRPSLHESAAHSPGRDAWGSLPRGRSGWPFGCARPSASSRPGSHGAHRTQPPPAPPPPRRARAPSPPSRGSSPRRWACPGVAGGLLPARPPPKARCRSSVRSAPRSTAVWWCCAGCRHTRGQSGRRAQARA
mmetsp:Transcript_34956/g.58894  ORF Transcript_34956/g.58894 Transcript_34956/m.58894 type:complete len:230 (+) Transcript_34956:803-1492(+)